MRQARRGWTMPEEDARSMLMMIEERIRSSDIRIEHRDALIRLRAMIEDDSAVSGPDSYSFDAPTRDYVADQQFGEETSVPASEHLGRSERRQRRLPLAGSPPAPDRGSGQVPVPGAAARAAGVRPR